MIFDIVCAFEQKHTLVHFFNQSTFFLGILKMECNSYWHSLLILNTVYGLSDYSFTPTVLNDVPVLFVTVQRTHTYHPSIEVIARSMLRLYCNYSRDEIIHTDSSERGHIPSLSNQDVLEIVKLFLDEGGSYNTALTFIKESTPRENSNFPLTSFISSVKSLETKRRSLNKSKQNTHKLENFLEELYRRPKRAEKRIISTRDIDLDSSKEKAASLERERDKLAESLSKVRQKVKNFQPKRINQKLKRKDEQLSKKRKIIRNLRYKCKSSSPIPSETLASQLAKCLKQKSNLRLYYRHKIQALSHTKTSGTSQECQEMKILRERIRVLEVENTELLDQLNRPARVISAKLDGKTYQDELRMVVYALATSNVAIESMRNVVNCVLELGQQELSEFPDVATCRAMVHEMNPLTKLHAAEGLDGAENTTVKYDGTTKSKVHWVEAQVATKHKTFTVALEKVVDGTADSYSGLHQKLDAIGIMINYII